MIFQQGCLTHSIDFLHHHSHDWRAKLKHVSLLCGLMLNSAKNCIVLYIFQIKDLNKCGKIKLGKKDHPLHIFQIFQLSSSYKHVIKGVLFQTESMHFRRKISSKLSLLCRYAISFMHIIHFIVLIIRRQQEEQHGSLKNITQISLKHTDK